MGRRGYIGATAPTSLASGIAAGDTSVTAQDLTTWAGITTNGPFAVTVHRDYPNEEQILVAAINTTTGVMSSVTRGYAGSTAVAHAAGETLEVTSTYLDFDEANAHVNDATRNDHTQYARLAAGSNTFTGQLLGKAISNYLGAGADGTANQSRVHFQSLDATDMAVIAENSTAANCNLVLRGLGTGTINLQAPGGNTMVRAEVGGATPAASTALSIECNGDAVALQRVVLGADDSAGTGYRTLRVPN